MIKVKRALISVSDKNGIVEFAKGLNKLGVEILSTGGTAQMLRSHGIAVIEVAEYTGFPEILDGRVKTLHPKIHGGLLAVRDNPQHMAQLSQHLIGLIDMVVINLYPFEKVIQKKNVSLEDAIENIDIGGPSMLRSAAKNHKSVAVCKPEKYQEILKELETNSGMLPDKLLLNLAVEAFQHTSQYDGIIHNFLKDHFRSNGFSKFPAELTLKFKKIQDLRYGENPHQSAVFYADQGELHGIPTLRQWHGKELSFNNILDINAAVAVIRDFSDPAAAIMKHNNPTGVAEDKTLLKAYKVAFKTDALSAFGGIIGLNRPVDEAVAQAIYKSGFMECVVAPSFHDGALKILKEKKNLRLITIDLAAFKQDLFDYKKVQGGLLLQDQDSAVLKEENLKVVTKIKPTKAQMQAMIFGWKVVKHVRSNAIVLVKGRQTVGIGCGLTSRVDSAIHAIRKAGKAARNACLISDAFLPKPDTVTIAAKAGVKAIIQTGGSVMDPEVIKEADRRKIAMVTTGIRHFKH